MLHSRLPTPKLNDHRQSELMSSSSVVRSKSTTTFAQMVSKMEQHLQKSNVNKEVKTLPRAQSAFRKNCQQVALLGLPKVSSMKGKLHLGKLVKPGVILSAEVRHNPWAEPTSINEMLINRKGLMNMVNMGMIPKNADFTELLNHKYQQNRPEPKPEVKIDKEQDDNFFQTNPNIAEQPKQVRQVVEIKPKEEPKQESKEIIEGVQSTSQKKIRKKIRKGSKLKRESTIFQLPEEPVILQISNQQVQKTDKYYEQLKIMKRTGQETTFKHFIRSVENFAVKYGFKKFQFKLLLDETRKMSDTQIRNQILNAKALGIHLTMKGNLRKRVNEIATMFAIRFKFKKSKRDLNKIENIKRYFKIKKYYEEMTKRRCDLLKFKLGSFAERQRRFLEESLEKNGANEKFRVQIHILATGASSYEEQLSYYKLEHRNNIQLTRMFSREPEHIILLMQQQQCDLSSWLSLLPKIKGYQPTIQPIFSSLRAHKVRSYDSIYYGINSAIVRRVKTISGKREDVCVYPTAYCGALVKICEMFNAKLYCSSFWKPHLEQLLEEEDENSEEQMYQSYKNAMDSNYQSSQQPDSHLSTPRAVSIQLIKSRIGLNEPVRTEAQMKHLFQRAKINMLNKYELNNEHFSNKLIIKRDIFLKSHCESPHSVIFEAGTEERQLYRKLTETILSFKGVNKWVFKIGTTARFSRGLAFLETDSLKILKEKKKKVELVQADIVEVTNIMKVILLDKLQIPQNSLHDSTSFLASFLSLGGYVEAVIVETSTQCIFGKITSTGAFELMGTYTKIYTDQVINCAGTYPSKAITSRHINLAKEIAQKLFKDYEIFGYVTFELLIERRAKKTYFIDLILSLEQYSSLYFMYTALFTNLKQPEQSLTILKKMNQKKILVSQATKKEGDKSRMNSVQSMKSDNEKVNEGLDMMREIVYIPFIDNNGNIYESFEEFEEICLQKQLKTLNFEVVQGLQFLFLNLKEQKPDVLSLVAFSNSQKKSIKYIMDGLNFLGESGERTNKFDKKVQRRRYDCLYIHDIIWKFRQIKKTKDSRSQQKQQQGDK